MSCAVASGAAFRCPRLAAVSRHTPHLRVHRVFTHASPHEATRRRWRSVGVVVRTVSCMTKFRILSSLFGNEIGLRTYSLSSSLFVRFHFQNYQCLTVRNPLPWKPSCPPSSGRTSGRSRGYASIIKPCYPLGIPSLHQTFIPYVAIRSRLSHLPTNMIGSSALPAMYHNMAVPGSWAYRKT